MRVSLARLRSAAAAVEHAPGPPRVPALRLFTGADCSLCDELKAVLARSTHPHTLESVDIGEKVHREWFRRYKWDIPVLHIDGKYFAKHRIQSVAELDSALAEAARGEFIEREGEPDARGKSF